MQLEKWYADVVDGGRLSVHYRARLSLGLLEIAYRGELGGKRHGTFSAGSEIDQALELLRREGLADRRTVETAGRSKEVWTLQRSNDKLISQL